MVRQLNGLSEVRGSACRERDKSIGGVGAEAVEIKRLTVFTAGKTDATATDCAGDLGIRCAVVAILVMWQRLVRPLRLFSQNVRYTVHQTTQLNEQQGKDKQ